MQQMFGPKIENSIYEQKMVGFVVLICENKMTRVGLEPTTSTYRGSNDLEINGGICDNKNDLDRYLGSRGRRFGSY